MVGGGAIFMLNNAIMKWATGVYPIGQILFLRSGCALIVLLVVAVWMRSLLLFRIKNLKGQILRAVILIVSTLFSFAGLKELPLATAVVISFSGPLVITALAPTLLQEQVGWRRWAAVSVGFMGVVVIIRPGTDAFQSASLLILAATLGSAMRDIVTRRLCATETSLSILWFTMVAATLTGFATLPLGWQPIRPDDMILFAAAGVLLTGSHYLLIEAFRLAEAALVAPFNYANIIWALIIGYLIWGDLPDRWTYVGTAVIVVSGLYILDRESRLHRRQF